MTKRRQFTSWKVHEAGTAGFGLHPRGIKLPQTQRKRNRERGSALLRKPLGKVIRLDDKPSTFVPKPLNPIHGLNILIRTWGTLPLFHKRAQGPSVLCAWELTFGQAH